VAFDSDEGAAESRRAVSGFLGIASRDGILAATTETFDLTPATEGKAPLAPAKTGGSTAAPDVLLVGQGGHLVVGVEVETRSEDFRKYPGRTPVEYAKLRSGILVDVSAVHYARALKGTDYDDQASWGHKNIEEILEDSDLLILDRHTLKDGTVLVFVSSSYLEKLNTLFRQFKVGKR
jgi:hypothetical protein